MATFSRAHDYNILSDISGVCGCGDSCDGCISSGGIFISPLSCHTGQARVAFKHKGVDTHWTDFIGHAWRPAYIHYDL